MSRLPVVVLILIRPHSTMEEFDMKNGMHSWIYTAVLVLVGISIALTGSVAAQSTGYVDVAAGDLAGSGTAADPYVITNVSELQAIEDDLDASYVLVNDINASVTANANAGKGFDPLGNTSQPFTGNLSGQGHTITGLAINRPSTRPTGLFGQIGTFGFALLNARRLQY